MAEKKEVPLPLHESFSSLDFQFGDLRIDRRANLMIDTMSKSCEKSLAQIFCNEADLKGAYRFFSNDLVSPEKIIQPHIKETIKRCKQEELVAILQDSSDLDYDYLECLEGFGPLHTNVEKGFRIHPLLAINECGTTLGILSTLNYTRAAESDSQKKHRNSLQIEEKESLRWLLGYREACKLAEQAPETTIVCISDREGDIYECLAEAQNPDNIPKAKILVRANHNRLLANPTDPDIDKLEKKLVRCPVIYEGKVHLNKYKKNERIANVAIRTSQVLVQAPSTCKKKSLPPIEINAVLVSEIDPPKGEQALHWLLLTTLPIDTREEVCRIISLYAKRWCIEIYFKVLKSGCGIDAPRFQTTSRIENFIALAMIVAWKVMLVTYLPREHPEAPCTIIFNEIEWKLAYSAAYKKQRPIPEKPPSLKEVVGLVAMLGGYRKRKDPPGIQTVWRGIVRLMDMTYGYGLTKG